MQTPGKATQGNKWISNLMGHLRGDGTQGVELFLLYQRFFQSFALGNVEEDTTHIVNISPFITDNVASVLHR